MTLRSNVVKMSVLLAFSAGYTRGEVRLPALFSDGMVLQREQEIPVWGFGRPGETIRFGSVTIRPAG